LNFAQNILETAYAPPDDTKTPVLTGVEEGVGEIEHISISRLRRRVGLLANALTTAGVQKLDRVACIGLNNITTFTVFLAATSIGATFACCSPEMGEKGILERFLQVKPKILFANDWVVYNGKHLSYLEKAKVVAAYLKEVAGLHGLVIVPRFREK
jgi:acetoacetyl-CoA synthetase